MKPLAVLLPRSLWAGCLLASLAACTHAPVAAPKPVAPPPVVVVPPPVAPPPVAAPVVAAPAEENNVKIGEEHLNQLLVSTLRADQKTNVKNPVTDTVDLDTAISTEFHDFIHPPAYDGVETDEAISNAVNKAKRRAATGDPFWLNFLGFSYVTGKGVPRDTRKGIEMITRAAATGNDKAMCTMARLNEIGLLVPMDKVKAVELYKECAKKEPGGWSMLRLGRIYEFGVGVPRDTRQAMSWYVQAAADPTSPNVYAEYAVGRMYAKGIGVARNYKRAAEWFLRASRYKAPAQAKTQRSGDAACAMAIMYKYGVGVEKNPNRSDLFLHLDLAQDSSRNADEGAFCKEI